MQELQLVEIHTITRPNVGHQNLLKIMIESRLKGMLNLNKVTLLMMKTTIQWLKEAWARKS